jgi:hypothetical protein
MQGIKGLGSEAGLKAAASAMPTGSGLAALGTAASAANEAAQPKQPVYQEDEYDKRLKAYKLSPNYQPAVPQQPNPYYTPVGLGYAEGGLTSPQLEQMAPGGLAAMQSQRDGYDPDTDAYGAEKQMAKGGITDLPRSPDMPSGGTFRDTDATTSKQDALEAAITQMKRRNKAAGLKDAAMPKASMDTLDNPFGTRFAEGGLGSYSDGGRMLKGPGDGMSDSIPASIGNKQPARLADGEFVVPADVVSHLGNGSTDAGAKKLYSMMDKIRTARTGKKKQAPAVKANKYLPA